MDARREKAIEDIQKGGIGFWHDLPTDLHTDREVVLEAVRRETYALEFVGEELRADREFMLEVVRHDGLAFQFASEALRSDRDFALEAVVKIGWALRFATDTLRSDREVVLEAVRSYGGALRFASADLRADKDVVVEAVRQDGLAFECACLSLECLRKEIFEAARSPIAVAGSQSPVFSVDVAAEEGGELKVIVYTMSGTEWDVTLPKEARLQDLGHWLVKKYGRSRHVFLLVAGHGVASPLAFGRALADYARPPPQDL